MIQYCLVRLIYLVIQTEKVPCFESSDDGEIKGNPGSRGSDVLAFPFNDSTPYLANFETDFLTIVKNKTNLNEYLAQKFLKFYDNDTQTICITYGDTVISSDNNVLTENLITVCTSEEADSRIIRHSTNLELTTARRFRYKRFTVILLYYPLVMLTL